MNHAHDCDRLAGPHSHEHDAPALVYRIVAEGRQIGAKTEIGNDVS
jgi:hypothetical protein